MVEAPEQVKFYEDRYYRDRTNLKHNLSFAGCGFLGLYHVGVCCCLKKLAPHLYQNKHISGSSAGAIAAVCLVCDVNIGKLVSFVFVNFNETLSRMCTIYVRANQQCATLSAGPFWSTISGNGTFARGLESNIAIRCARDLFRSIINLHDQFCNRKECSGEPISR